MSPRPRRVSDEEIVAATGRVLARDGPAELTVAAVAAEAGLAASSLLGRVGSRRALLLAFAAGGATGLRATFTGARAAGGSPLATLHAALVALTGGVTTRAVLAHHLALLQLDVTDREFRAHAVAWGRAFRAEVEALVGEAAAHGELPPGDAAARARAVHAVYNGVLVTWAIHGEGRLRDAVAEVVPLALGPR